MEIDFFTLRGRRRGGIDQRARDGAFEFQDDVTIGKCVCVVVVVGIVGGFFDGGGSGGCGRIPASCGSARGVGGSVGLEMLLA